MAKKNPRSPQQQPWENGWTPDTSREPGTRRLWLAGAVALATIVACVTAIAVMDKDSDDTSPSARGAAPAADTSGPGLISFATPPTGSAGTPSGTSGPPSARPSKTATGHRSTRPTATPTPTASAKPSKSPASHGSSSRPKPSSTGTSIRSVNYPDRYWQVSGSYVALDPVGSRSDRQDATFKRVKGLADASCYSFRTSNGSYLRHRNFVLRSEYDDGSSLFEQDATFCPRASSYPGAVALESINYPGRFLRHQNFRLRLDPYQNSALYQADSAFRLVQGLS
ncbi:AbfB domain-containing protein [Streptomyces sp. SAS_270]|uniref:AbfB domain-containing protein n=1 Tax=Streptomyces sp. SAS_270 TaxID=3412748 RepID=UPI00403D2E9F